MKKLSTFRFFQAQYPTVKTLFIPRGYAREHIPENLVGKRGGTAKVWVNFCFSAVLFRGLPLELSFCCWGKRRSPWRHLAKKMCIFITRRITLTSSRLHLRRIFPWAAQGEMFINSGNVNNRKENKLFLKKRLCSKLTAKRLAERDNRERISEDWIRKILEGGVGKGKMLKQWFLFIYYSTPTHIPFILFYNILFILSWKVVN